MKKYNLKEDILQNNSWGKEKNHNKNKIKCQNAKKKLHIKTWMNMANMLCKKKFINLNTIRKD